MTIPTGALWPYTPTLTPETPMTDRRVNITLTFATDAPTGDVLEAVTTAVARALGPAIELEAVSQHAFVLDTTEDDANRIWDTSTPPGGWVCAFPGNTPVAGSLVCGYPVESEGCPEHREQRDGSTR